MMSRQWILIIEDEEDIQQLVSYHLIKSGYGVLCADSGEEGLDILAREKIDLVILDLMLPGIDGGEVCRRIRCSKRGGGPPIIMLTAKGEEEDIIQGLEAGADDYITKPFSPKVLLARIKARLRRESISEAASRQFGSRLSLPQGLEIDFDLHEVFLNGRSLSLTVTEFSILGLLAARPGKVFSRQQIIDSIRGRGYEVTSRAGDVHIHGLRKKLGDAGERIETVRGVGYRFKGESA